MKPKYGVNHAIENAFANQSPPQIQTNAGVKYHITRADFKECKRARNAFEDSRYETEILLERYCYNYCLTLEKANALRDSYREYATDLVTKSDKAKRELNDNIDGTVGFFYRHPDPEDRKIILSEIERSKRKHLPWYLY